MIRVSTGMALLVGALLFCIGMASAETFRINVHSAQGFTKAGEVFIPLTSAIDLTGTGAVSFEAEARDEATFAKGGKVLKDGAEGPTYVGGFQALKYYYTADKAATLSLWARMRQLPGEQLLYLNGGTWRSSDADQKEAGKWRWVRLGNVAIQPGEHDLRFFAGWPGYNHPPQDPWPHSLQLDSFMLIPGTDKPEDAKAAPARIAPKTYTVVSEDFTLPAATRLITASISLGTPGILEASTDAGNTWVAATNLPIAGTLRLRLRFPDGAPKGFVSDFSATIATDPARYLAIDNGKVHLGVDVDGAGLFRMESTSGVSVAPPAAIPLFSLELKQRGKPWPNPRYILQPKDGKLLASAAKGQAITLTYAFLDGKLKATVTIGLEKNSYDTKWALALDNKSEWDVLTYTFPRLTGLKVGGSGYDDTWLNTNFYGPWVAGYNCFGSFRPEDRPYPGWGRLGYADLSDATAGLTIATREPEIGMTNYVMRPVTPQVSETVSLETVKEHCVPAGKTMTWHYSILLHAGDWHAGADAYGAWFDQRFGKAVWSEWVRDDNGWVQANPSLSDAVYKWPHLLNTYEDGRRMGITHLQGWGQFGSGSCATFWWPSPKYGPIEEFAAMNKKIRDMGGHVGYYLMYDRENRYNMLDTETYEGYLPRTAYPPGVPVITVEQLIKGCRVSDPTGKVTAWPTTEAEMNQFKTTLANLLKAKKQTVWAAGSMIGMNPLDKDWQASLKLWTNELYMGKWHCDFMYQDVLGCGNVGRSFDLRRGDHGEVFNSEMTIARILAQDGKRVNPDSAFISEGCSELVGRWAAGMNSSAHYGWMDLSATRYTHPNQIIYFGGANGGYRRMAQQCDICYLSGARFDLILTGDVARVRRTVTFREGFKRFSFRADYKDTVGVSVLAGDNIDATRHDRFDAQTQSILVTVLNRDQVTDGVLKVETSRLPQGKFGAFWLTDDWTTTQATLTQVAPGIVTTPIPRTHLSALLLVAKTGKDEQFLAGILPERVPGGCRNSVWVANLTPRAQTVTLTCTGAGMGKVAPEKVTLPAFGAYARTVDGVFAPGEETFGDVRVQVNGNPLGHNYLYPMIEDGSFEANGTNVPDAADGARVLRVGPGTGWQGGHRLLGLAPGHRYRITLQMRRSGTKGEMSVIVRLLNGEGKWQHTGLRLPADTPNNTWTTLSTEFDTPAVMKESDIYFYNHNSEDTADYDNVKVEMLR